MRSILRGSLGEQRLGQRLVQLAQQAGQVLPPGRRVARVLARQKRRSELVQQGLLRGGAARDLKRRTEQVRLTSMPVEVERRAQVLATQLGAERAQSERDLLGRAAALLGIAQRRSERRASPQLEPHDELLALGAGLRRLQGDQRLGREAARGLRRRHRRAAGARSARPRAARTRPGRGPRRRSRRPGALGARLAHVVRREAARVPGRRLGAHLLALVHVAECPVGVAAIEVFGRAGRVALARARRPVDLGMQDGDRDGSRRLRHQRREVGALAVPACPIATTCPSVSPPGPGSSTVDGLVRECERAAGLRERGQRAAGIVVAAREDHGRAGLTHARELRECVMQRGGPGDAALEEIAGDDECVRAPLDRQLADPCERLSLGGAHPRPHAGVEARAGGVEMAIRGVDDPQHGCRSLALRSAGAACEIAHTWDQARIMCA